MNYLLVELGERVYVRRDTLAGRRVGYVGLLSTVLRWWYGLGRRWCKSETNGHRIGVPSNSTH